jgi:hypothetical protein
MFRSGDRNGGESVLSARTLAEAMTYVSLLQAADDSRTADPTGPPETTLVEGAEAWTVRSAFGDVEVRYVSEHASRNLGVRFGLGVSQLIDAGQWILVADTYARRALDADLQYTGQPGQDRAEVELNWQVAADAVDEAIKFLPERADRLPEEAFWSPQGLKLRRDDPGRTTRARLVDDREYYTGTLEDFRALYDKRS